MNKDFDEKDLMKDIEALNPDGITDKTADLSDTARHSEAKDAADTEALSEGEDVNSTSGEGNIVKADSAVEGINEETDQPKRRKGKKVFTRAQVILIVIIAVLIVLAGGTTVICTVTDTNPISYIVGEASKSKLVNKWQSQTNPGLSAYEFFEDGTYTSYLSTYTFDGEYEVQGNKLILKNSNSGQSVIYKYSIVGDTLSLTLCDSNGNEISGSEASKFDRVDSLNQKSLQDIIESYRESLTADDDEDEDEDTTEEDTAEEDATEEASAEEDTTEETTTESEDTETTEE